MSEHPDRQAASDLEPEPSRLERQDIPDQGTGLTPVLVACWRCGKEVDARRGICRYCRARLLPEPGRAPTALPRDSGTLPPVKLVWVFAIFLIVSLIYGWLVHFGLSPEAIPKDRQVHERQSLWMLAVELIDTLLLGVALWWIGRPPALPSRSGKQRLAAWLAAVPVLMLLLSMNLGYHWLLRNFLNFPMRERAIPATEGLLGWLVLTSCLQPAIVEELFFRYLALGILQKWTGIHTAVLISAVMFGMAHIFAPFSIPLLMGIGVALGYLRVASGSLILPMLIHFGHNALVLWGEFRL